MQDPFAQWGEIILIKINDTDMDIRVTSLEQLSLAEFSGE